MPRDRSETVVIPKKPCFLDVPALGIDSTYPNVGNVSCFGNTIKLAAVIQIVFLGALLPEWNVLTQS